MIRADGYVKVLDFGLAKLAAVDPFGASPDAATRLLETRDGVVMGTFSYMAPEQARGGDIDHARRPVRARRAALRDADRARPPFNGPTAADVVGAVLFREPEPPGRTVGMPAALERIVMTALRKDRAERYQSGAQLLQDLSAIERTLEPGGEVTRASVAALAQAALTPRPGPRTPWSSPP